MPPEENIEMARVLWDKAGKDLLTARQLSALPDSIPESIGFHVQQCAEKSLKAFLTFHGVFYAFRHDLSYLIDLCAPLDGWFESLRDQAEAMTPFAVEHRYEDAPLEATREEVIALVEAAALIRDYVGGRLEFL